MADPSPTPLRLGAVVLTGGTAARLGGIDKASIRLDGVTLLERALAATSAAREVVVVGTETPTTRPVTWTREDPPGGGPAAGLLAALDRFTASPDLVVVLAVDMPKVSSGTVARLTWAVEASAEVDGAVLVDATGRRQTLAGVYRRSALQAARPADREQEHGLPVRRLVERLRIVDVPAVGDEARDLDTWTDLEELSAHVLPDRESRTTLEGVNLHDWIDELCDALDVDAEVDEALILDLARDAAHAVQRTAAPISTYLLGYAAALAGGSPEKVEELAGRASALAESWGGEQVSADDFEEAEEPGEVPADVDADLVDAD